MPNNEEILKEFDKFWDEVPAPTKWGEKEAHKKFFLASLEKKEKEVREEVLEEVEEEIKKMKTSPTTQHSYFNAAMDLVLSNLASLKPHRGE